MQNIGLLEKGQSMKVKGRRRSGTCSMVDEANNLTIVK
jgi:hypothetical protein